MIFVAKHADWPLSRRFAPLQALVSSGVAGKHRRFSCRARVASVALELKGTKS